MNTDQARLWALALPKAEQHIHDVGSMPVDMLNAYAKRYNATADLPPGLAAGSYSFEGQGLPGFVGMYVSACTVLRSGDDYRELGKRISLDLAKQNTRYARVHHTAAIPGARDGLWDEPLEGLLQGFKEGAAEGGALCHVLMDIPAEFDGFYPDNDFRERTAASAVKHRCTDNSVPGVVAVGVAGDESKTDFASYKAMIETCRDAGLEVAVHAGESQGAQSIRSALDELQPDRIEHGIAAITDPAVVSDLVERRIPLDMAPVSNMLLSNLPAVGLTEHSLPALLASGVTITVSTDDPTMFRSDTNNEFAAVLAMGVSAEDACGIAANAWDDPFAPEALRAQAQATISTIASSDPQDVLDEVRGSMSAEVDTYLAFAKANDTVLPTP